MTATEKTNTIYKSIIASLLIVPIETALKCNVANYIYADEYDTENIEIEQEYNFEEEDLDTVFKLAAKVCVGCLGNIFDVVFEGTIDDEGEVTLCIIHCNNKRYYCGYDKDDMIELK